jgi:hypothetical protein
MASTNLPTSTQSAALQLQTFLATPVAGTSYQGEVPANLSVDSILAYCEARVSSLSSMLQDKMTTQTAQNAKAKAYTDLQSLLSTWGDGVSDGATVQGSATLPTAHLAMARQLMTQYAATNDPDVRAQIANAFQEVTGRSIDSVTKDPASFAADDANWGKGAIDPKTGVFVPNPVLDPSNIKRIEEAQWTPQLESLKSAANQVSQDGQMDMIQIQSMVSQMQQAVQLSSQIMQSIQQTAMATIANMK